MKLLDYMMLEQEQFRIDLTEDFEQFKNQFESNKDAIWVSDTKEEKKEEKIARPDQNEDKS